MQSTFSKAIVETDHDAILSSPLLKRWLHTVERNFQVAGIHFESADFVSRKGERILLFLKLKAEATDLNGKRVPGIIMLRGDVVGILVVLWCDHKPHVLLVDQPRFAIGERHSLEIVAGMLDWSSDWRTVALAELEEEAGLDVEDAELVALGEPIAVSCGLLDEKLQLAVVERTVSIEDLQRMHGRAQTYLEEDEGIQTKVLAWDEALTSLTDSKSLLAMYRFEKLKKIK